MNILLEDPIQFNTRKKVGNIEVVYSELVELGQGGPEVGRVSINNILLEGRFGGPLLVYEDYVYLPMYLRKFFVSGFKLVRVSIETLKIEGLSNIQELIFLNKVENGKVYYYEDLNKTTNHCIKV